MTDADRQPLLKIQQRRIPALRGDIHADRLLGRIPDQAVRPAGLRARP